MAEYDDEKLDVLLRLTKENNRMLHAMRRNSFIGGIVKTLVWLAFILVPLWLYMEYVMPMLQSMLDTYSKIQGTSAQAQAQLGQMSGYMQQFQSLFGGKQ